jgi:hypothetical protein
MALDTTNTRPVQDGGIDLSGIDIEAAIFEATGGGYGGGQTNPTTPDGEPTKTPDWVTNFGSTPIIDEFDFGQPPTDPDAEIKLLAEPEGSHPLLELFKGEDQPVFANGGPEGTSCGAAVAAVVVIVIFLWAVDHLSDGAICDALGWEHDKGRTDPDAEASALPSPADMLTDLLKKNGIEGIDTSSVEITDILARLSDNMGKATDIVTSMQDAAKSGDDGAFNSALASLMDLAGLDAALFDLSGPVPETMLENVLNAFGIEGGLEGFANLTILQDERHVEAIEDGRIDWAEYVKVWTDDFA